MIDSLAYTGFVSPAAEAWRRFGPEVLGAQLVERDDGAVGLRIDDAAERLVIHPGDDDDLAYIGWDCGDAAGVEAAAERVAAFGLEVDADGDLAATRHVDGLMAFTDPWGHRHELIHRLSRVGAFTAGRPMDGGFVTGPNGMGHLVKLVPDLDAGVGFYVDALGFRMSDHIEARISLRFLHCNARHHTIALAEVPGMTGVHHLMLEVERLDDVGRALDVVNEREIPLAMTLGRHTNDLMTSFYVRTPSGFEIEYGTGGRIIDDGTWAVDTYDAMSLWGHRRPATPLPPGVVRPVA